jgi:hypothetical protein
MLQNSLGKFANFEKIDQALECLKTAKEREILKVL